jgi:hypothetical protein
MLLRLVINVCDVAYHSNVGEQVVNHKYVHLELLMEPS